MPDAPKKTVAVGTARPRHRTRLALPRAGARFVLAIFASGATAFASLLVEGLFPPGAGPWNRDLPDNRFWALGFVVSIALTVWAAWSLRAQSRQRGTLYYLRLQADTVPDLHKEAVASAASSYLGYRSVTAWLDPGLGTVDVRRQVESVSAELQRAINDDSDDSGFDIAPNLVFPAALAVGFDWVPPREVRMREINGPRNGRQTPGFDWFLHCATRSGHGCRMPVDHRREVQHFKVTDEVAATRISQHTTSPTAPTVRYVWLELILSDQDRTIASPLKEKSDLIRTVACFAQSPRALVPRPLAYRSKSGDHQLSVVQVAEAGAYWIGQTFVDFPDATIIVACAAPKTVTFAIGHLLGRPFPPHPAGHIWRKLVPMGHFQFEEPEMRPMWVRHDQTNPDLLLAPLIGLPHMPSTSGKRPTSAIADVMRVLADRWAVDRAPTS